MDSEITVKQASIRLGKVIKTVHNMIKDGRLQARLIDAPKPYYLVSIASIEAYEQKQNESTHSAK